MTTPQIVLGGKTFTVPVMVWKQNRILLPAIAMLFRSFGTLVQNAMLAAAASKDDTAQIDFTEVLGSLVLTAEQFNLMEEIIVTCVQGGTPNFTKEAMQELPIMPLELLSALPVILRQTGILKPVAADKLQDSIDKVVMASGLSPLGEAPPIGLTG